MLDVIVAVAGIVLIGLLTVIVTAAFRLNNENLVAGRISAHVWRNRDRLAGVIYLALLCVILLLAAMWGDLRG